MLSWGGGAVWVMLGISVPPNSAGCVHAQGSRWFYYTEMFTGLRLWSNCLQITKSFQAHPPPFSWSSCCRHHSLVYSPDVRAARWFLSMVVERFLDPVNKYHNTLRPRSPTCVPTWTQPVWESQLLTSLLRKVFLFWIFVDIDPLKPNCHQM